MEESRVRKKTYSQLYRQARRIMYNAGRQYGLGTERQRSLRHRAKLALEKYEKRIDRYFSKKGIDIYGHIPIPRSVYMGNANG